MKDPKFVSDQFGKCPHCRREIIITWGSASLLTLEEYQQEVHRILKNMDEEEKNVQKGGE